jgi:hypothetical protein
MKGTILDTVHEDRSNCYLTKITLKDFVMSLSEEYREYEIQREIVTNTYLDNLIETVLQKRHIPPIVLVIDAGSYQLNGSEIQISEFKILDGLQRTYRLKSIWETIQFFSNELNDSDEFLSFNRLQLARKFSNKLERINSNSKILESIVKFYKDHVVNRKNVSISDCFQVSQWFEVWSNLSPEQEVNKMLVLNAGHKPVKTQHQLELLFLNIIPIIKKAGLASFHLIREKESNSTVFSKNRSKGQFHFSHLITSIMSLNEGKPITANVNLIHKTQSTDFNIEDYSKYFNYDFLHGFITLLLALDDALLAVYSERGIKWLAREVSLVGMFAALGKYGTHNMLTPLELLDELQKKVVLNPLSLNVIEFEKLRNSQDLSKINIGTVNKNAIYEGVFKLLSESLSEINWAPYFKATVSA